MRVTPRESGESHDRGGQWKLGRCGDAGVIREAKGPLEDCIAILTSIPQNRIEIPICPIFYVVKVA